MLALLYPGDEPQKTLVTAQNMSDEIKQRAEAQAELILREARMKAERMLQQAQDQLARLESEISRCKVERDLFQMRLRSMIDGHRTLLEHEKVSDDEPDNLRVLPRRAGSEAG